MQSSEEWFDRIPVARIQFQLRATANEDSSQFQRVALAAGNWVLATGFLYQFSVHELAERLLKSIRKEEMIKAGDRVAVAVSGGADSLALLLMLLELRPELGIVLRVAHVNHQLRGEESDA